MPTYKIEQAFGAGEQYSFQGSDGSTVTLVPYTAILSGPDAPNQPVTINRVPESPEPTVGEELEGIIKQGKRGPTFKKADTFGGGGSGSDGGKYDRRPDHPQTQARYRHTSALSAAPDYMKLAMESPGVAPTPKTWDEFWTLAEQTIAKLEATYQGEARG
jgi:hypothetical protein